MQNKLIIIGCGGHSRSVADVYLQNNPNDELVFVDSNAKQTEKIFGFPVVSEYDIKNEKVFVAIGDNQKRAVESKKYANLCSIIAKNAYVGRGTEIGKGVFIANNAHIGAGSTIADNTIINTSASIDHEVFIGANCHIAPNVSICGRTEIGSNVFVGAGANIIDGIKICDNAVIGAGAVVVKDITNEGVYVGCPAKKIK